MVLSVQLQGESLLRNENCRVCCPWFEHQNFEGGGRGRGLKVQGGGGGGEEEGGRGSGRRKKRGEIKLLIFILPS